jgi:hypothetical protein
LHHHHILGFNKKDAVSMVSLASETISQRIPSEYMDYLEQESE